LRSGDELPISDLVTAAFIPRLRLPHLSAVRILAAAAVVSWSVVAAEVWLLVR
jgi:hypothetical protein